MSSENLLGALYWNLSAGRNDTNVGCAPPEKSLVRRKFKYIDMFVGRQIY